MIRQMIFLAMVVVFGGIQVGVQVAHSQENVQVRDPRMKEGQMVTVRIVPGAKQVKVFLIGKEMAKIESSDVGLQAFVRVGDEMRPVKTKRQGDHYTVEKSAKADELRLKVNVGGKAEDFDFRLR